MLEGGTGNMAKLNVITAFWIGLIAPSVAAACGGFFCNAQPVDQQAERIIFVQEDENTVTSYVEIQYQGAPDAFAWIVPVPAVPDLDTWQSMSFNALDLVTEPQWNFQDDCFFLEADAPAANRAGEDGGDPVIVLDQRRVGPFDTVTLQSADPRELVQWLRDNEYRIIPAMEPFIALYTAENMKFLAMKLAPGEDTDSIQPIKMTYTAANPAIPLRLTAVAAQLEMGVKVWILGDQKYGARNVPDIAIGDDEVVMDFNRWENNYLPLVARKVDAAGGKGFVTELAEPTERLVEMVRDSVVPDRVGQEGIDARDALAELLASKPYITRLYTRLSPEEMDIDPIFERIDGPDVSNIHVIESERNAEEENLCDNGELPEVDACAFEACGAGGRCAELDQAQGQQRAGCACVDGTIARAGFDPQGRQIVSCGDARIDFSSAPMDSGQIQFPDLCSSGNFCGQNGECLTLNGFPACRCQQGFVAIPNIDAQGMLTPTCVASTAANMLDLSSIELREPNLPYPGRVTAMDPMPVDMVDDQMDMTQEPIDPATRPQGMMTSSGSGGGCQSHGPQSGSLWMLMVLIGLWRVRKAKL
ncbi:MAG: hypothetical protein CMH52_03765 [Myxococcales bacterium]|nr:hypothetical protein [Myxococcales bacterium]